MSAPRVRFLLMIGASLISVAATVRAAEAPSAVTSSSEAPPPSTYDLQRQKHGTEPREVGSLTGQLLRTLFSLIFVVALIYAGGRVVLWRLGRGRVGSGASLKVVERLALDPKHTIFVVDGFGKRRLLLGVGNEKAVTLLDAYEPEQKSAASFAGELAKDRPRAASSEECS